MGVLINEQRQQKNEIITAVNRNVPNFSLETVKATFVNFGFVIHSPSMGIESEDLGQSETFVLWEWVG